MTTFSSQLFELLKSFVLASSQLKRIEASDCKILSSFIFTKTSSTVSETTLKRIYGFASSKFKPSFFTIDVLAKYCGYKGWEDFCDNQDKLLSKASNENIDWDSLSHQAAKITNFTLQALKNKSGVPFNQSIKRTFINKHLDEFLNGEYVASILTAPPGYGKTIALCHWIDEKLALNITAPSNDIILFFSSNALMNVLISGKDFHDWLLALLGYTLEEDIISLLDADKRKEGNFYLIIDGLDDHMFKNNRFELLLDQLMDIFSFYQSHSWFKMIFTMRSANWINNRHIMDHEHPKWFTGTINDELNSNVPLFNLNEIKELCLKINPDMQTQVSVDVANSFNHPLYFQFYYKQHRENFTLNNVDHTCIYELISVYIYNKIYLGSHAADKVSLLKGLIESMDFKKREYDIDKLKVNSLLNQYNQAYKELIGIGFLKETNTSDTTGFNTYVQFGNSNFLELAITNKLLQDNNQVFDAHLIKIINQLFFNNDIKVAIIKWCVMHAIKNGQQDNLDLLPKIDLNPREKSELIIFLGDLLSKTHASANNNGTMAAYFNQDCSDGLFYYFFGLELINEDYKKTLQTLLKFELSNRKKILTYTSLAITAVLQLDVTSLEFYLVKLRSFSREEYQEFTISPLDSLTAIYYFFKHGIIKKDFFMSLTRFYFNPPKQAEYLKYSPTNNLSYLLAGYTLLICRNPHKTLRYINAIQNPNSKDTSGPVGYNFLLKIMAADAYFSLGNIKEFKAIHDPIAEMFKTKESSFTSFMKLLFYSLKTKKAILTNQYTAIPGYFKYINQATDQSGNKLAKIFVTNLILNKSAVVKQDQPFYKQLAYNNAKLIRECGLNTEVFELRNSYLND
jgi:hypothetical protein